MAVLLKLHDLLDSSTFYVLVSSQSMLAPPFVHFLRNVNIKLNVRY